MVERRVAIWLKLTPEMSVNLLEPDVGPYFQGKHWIGSGWRWYEAGQLWGPNCRYRWLCRFRHWRGERRGY